MICEDEDSLICDLAETYGVFDYRGIPVKLLATLCCGLREDSRIKMKLSGLKIPVETLLLSTAVDKLSFLAWTKTKDAENGDNRPNSITAILLGHKSEKEIIAFDSAEEFELAKAKAQGRL
jgi:hypothetical protein